MIKNKDLNPSFIKDSLILEELTQSSDRTKVILGSAILEELLERLLKKHFILNTKLTEEVFEPSAFLGSFSSKIKISFLLGLISQEMFDDLEIIRELRNKFAHRIHQSSLLDQSATSLCNNFKFVKKIISTDWRKCSPDMIFILELGILEGALVKKITRSKHFHSVEFEFKNLGFEEIDHNYLNDLIL